MEHPLALRQNERSKSELARELYFIYIYIFKWGVACKKYSYVKQCLYAYMHVHVQFVNTDNRDKKETPHLDTLVTSDDRTDEGKIWTAYYVFGCSQPYF